jgi:hypothetical protein
MPLAFWPLLVDNVLHDMLVVQQISHLVRWCNIPHA